MEEMEF